MSTPVDLPDRLRHALAAPWPKTPAEGRAEQQRLRTTVSDTGDLPPLRRLAALDAHFAPDRGLAWGAVAVLSWPGLNLVESALACRPLDFPYVSGLLSFRECPALLAALASITTSVDLLLVDGQGRAHPRRFGLACHLGVLAGLPTIGIAKSRLFGRHDEPAMDKGATAPLRDGDEVIGTVLRSCTGKRPIYVSVGHAIGLAAATDFVLQCTPRYRLPEPIRIADALSRMHAG